MSHLRVEAFEPVRATWRGTTSVCACCGVQAVSFLLDDGSILRLLLARADQGHLLATLGPRGREGQAVCHDHADRSGSSPDRAGSIPADGQVQCPPAMSSSAASGV